jgi:Tfp pilus assembly pilus retraction ATPase PilT
MRTRPGARFADGSQPKRIAGLEVMISTPAIANQIRQNQIGQIRDVMQTSRALGMFTLEDHLYGLVQGGLVEPEQAIAHAQDPQGLTQRLGHS